MPINLYLRAFFYVILRPTIIPKISPLFFEHFRRKNSQPANPLDPWTSLTLDPFAESFRHLKRRLFYSYVSLKICNIYI